jgi:hypothetical protein
MSHGRLNARWIRVLEFMKPISIVLAIIIGCSSAAALTTSRLYWGYWLLVPSADWAVSGLASTERFTTSCCGTDPQSGRTALREAARTEWDGAGNPPVEHLPLALIRQGVEPLTDEAVPASVLSSIRDTLDSAGALAEGEAGYTHAKSLGGHVAMGRDRQGRERIVAALFGGEASNDHHPYYEAAFERTSDGRLRLLGVRRYWFDVAGLEGFAHWLGAIVGAIIGVVISCAFLFGWRAPRWKAESLTRATTLLD